jgi:hypothetical protein
MVRACQGCLIAVKGGVSAWDDPAGGKVVCAVGRRRRMRARAPAGQAKVGNALVEEDAATRTPASPAASPRPGRPCRRAPAGRGDQRASAAGSGGNSAPARPIAGLVTGELARATHAFLEPMRLISPWARVCSAEPPG